jgi:hypothetical protein
MPTTLDDFAHGESSACDHASVDAEPDQDGTWLERWCVGCGKDLSGEPIGRCSDCGRRVPYSRLDLCCRTTRDLAVSGAAA